MTGISLDLGGGFSPGAGDHSCLSASCPAPAGFHAASFPLSRASLSFGGQKFTQSLTRSCKVR